MLIREGDSRGRSYSAEFMRRYGELTPAAHIAKANRGLRVLPSYLGLPASDARFVDPTPGELVGSPAQQRDYCPTVTRHRIDNHGILLQWHRLVKRWRSRKPPPCSDRHTLTAIGISCLGRTSLGEGRSVVHWSPFAVRPFVLRGAIDRIRTGNLEAPPGFEPGMEVLQTSALPLGDGAVRTTNQAGISGYPKVSIIARHPARDLLSNASVEGSRFVRRTQRTIQDRARSVLLRGKGRRAAARFPPIGKTSVAVIAIGSKPTGERPW